MTGHSLLSTDTQGGGEKPQVSKGQDRGPARVSPLHVAAGPTSGGSGEAPASLGVGGGERPENAARFPPGATP